jgi:hypothetical protein
VVNSLLAMEYNPGICQEQQFLMMAQAAETYHRRAYPRPLAEPELHEARQGNPGRRAAEVSRMAIGSTAVEQ